MKFKCTQYFLYARKKADRAQIKDKWIEQVVNNPTLTVVQSDGRIRKWAFIEDEKKYLRVILLKDGVTVHNAFFDQKFRRDQA